MKLWGTSVTKQGSSGVAVGNSRYTFDSIACLSLVVNCVVCIDTLCEFPRANAARARNEPQLGG